MDRDDSQSRWLTDAERHAAADQLYPRRSRTSARTVPQETSAVSASALGVSAPSSVQAADVVSEAAPEREAESVANLGAEAEAEPSLEANIADATRKQEPRTMCSG